MTSRADIHEATASLLSHMGPPLARALAPVVPSTTRAVRTTLLRALAAVWLVEDGPRELDLRAVVAAALDEFDLLGASIPTALHLSADERRALGAASAAGGRAIRVPLAPAALALGAAYEVLLAHGITHRGVEASLERRRSGAHHTDPEIARDVVRRALEPVERATSVAICDPAMGSGVFLVEAAERIANATGRDRAEVIALSIFGVDNDPIATSLARLSLGSFAGNDPRAAAALAQNLVTADFVVRPEALESGVAKITPLDPQRTFARVFSERGGFDAIVGNPPWVAFAGRAAQPIDRALSRYLARTSAAFAGYRTLHGVFVERATRMLREGGRLGLVVPTSMADLDGYAPARRAHDEVAMVDEKLPDYGARAFDGVFQPAMGLLSTRTASGRATIGESWDLDTDEVDPIARDLIERARRAPLVPAACFAERGFQTEGKQKTLLTRAPQGRRLVGLRCGTDIRPFEVRSPTYYCDPTELGSRFRVEAEWRKVDLYVRQTARFYLAAPADGAPFRNSVLAGFATGELTTPFLLAYLNSTLIRFLHYARFRDARQGMPQVKIAHLRKIPLPPDVSPRFVADLSAYSAPLVQRNEGIRDDEQAFIDGLVAAAWDLPGEGVDRIAAWAKNEGRIPAARSERRKYKPLCSSVAL